MNSNFLSKDEIMFLERKLKRKGFTWEQIDYRMKKIKTQLKKLKDKLQKKDLTDKERNILFKEEFAKLVSR